MIIVFSKIQTKLTNITTLCGQNKVFWTVNLVIYTECPRRNVRDFGKVFLMLNYTDITQNTYIQSLTVT